MPMLTTENVVRIVPYSPGSGQHACDKPQSLTYPSMGARINSGEPFRSDTRNTSSFLGEAVLASFRGVTVLADRHCLVEIEAYAELEKVGAGRLGAESDQTSGPGRVVPQKRSTTGSKACQWRGLDTKAAAPSCTVLFAVSPSAESTTTGTSASARSLRCATRNSQPSITGIMRSSKMSPGRLSEWRMRSSASLPLAAHCTSYPSRESTSASASRWARSSSTTRIFEFIKVTAPEPRLHANFLEGPVSERNAISR